MGWKELEIALHHQQRRQLQLRGRADVLGDELVQQAKSQLSLPERALTESSKHATGFDVGDEFRKEVCGDYRDLAEQSDAL
jgi:hypothetical protein